MEVKDIIDALTSAEDFLPKKEEGSARLKQYLSDLPGSISAKAVMEGTAYSEERERVRYLRLSGKACEEIATELEMPEVLIQAYCLELGLPTEGSCRLVELSKDEESWYQDKMQGVPLARLCPQCGQEVHQSRHGSRKIYCSDRCRYRWRDIHRKQNAKGRNAVCENCGQTFTAYGEYTRKRRFCCRECYFEFRNRKAVQENEENEGSRGKEDAGYRRVPDHKHGGDLCT